jgi:hypothetical protein
VAKGTGLLTGRGLSIGESDSSRAGGPANRAAVRTRAGSGRSRASEAERGPVRKTLVEPCGKRTPRERQLSGSSVNWPVANLRNQIERSLVVTLFKSARSDRETASEVNGGT